MAPVQPLDRTARPIPRKSRSPRNQLERGWSGPFLPSRNANWPSRTDRGDGSGTTGPVRRVRLRRFRYSDCKAFLQIAPGGGKAVDRICHVRQRQPQKSRTANPAASLPVLARTNATLLGEKAWPKPRACLSGIKRPKSANQSIFTDLKATSAKFKIKRLRLLVETCKQNI